MKRFEFKHQRRITLKEIRCRHDQEETHLRRIKLYFSDDFESNYFGSPIVCSDKVNFDDYEKLTNNNPIRGLQVRFDKYEDIEQNSH